MTLTYSKKIFISYFFIFLFFAALLYPFAGYSVRDLVRHAVQERASALVNELVKKKDLPAVLDYLKMQEASLFMRVSLLSEDGRLLFDSHLEDILGEGFSSEYRAPHKGLSTALKLGSEYHEGYSTLLKQRLVYISRAFTLGDDVYVLRVALPLSYLELLTEDFKEGFFFVGCSLLLLFTFFTWLITTQLSKPIYKIIKAISRYQLGDIRTLSKMRLQPNDYKGDFYLLARTLSELSVSLQEQFEKLEDQKNERDTLLQSLTEGVIAVDKDVKITYLNQAAQKILVDTGRHVLGEPFSCLQEPACERMLKQVFETGSVLQQELYLERMPEVFFDVVASPLPRRLGAILVLEDKTEQYKTIEMKKDFISNASHELKTPITVILGFAEMLNDTENIDKELLKMITGKLVFHSHRADTLIKSLLAMSTAENIARYRFEELAIDDLVRDCVTELLDLHPEVQVTVVPPKEACTVEVDRELLRLAISNLLSNAVRYSPAPATIILEMYRDGDRVVLKVADKGIGIPQEDLKNIFHRFYTVDKAHSRKKGGSGLGLSIVKTVVDKHNGQISIASELGKGTCFTLVLPFKEGHVE